MSKNGLNDVVVAKEDDHQRYAVVEEENACNVCNGLEIPSQIKKLVVSCFGQLRVFNSRSLIYDVNSKIPKQCSNCSLYLYSLEN